MHVLPPGLTPRGGILVRVVSCGIVGMAGVVIYKLSHSNDVIGTCICECVWLRPLWVGGQ